MTCPVSSVCIIGTYNKFLRDIADSQIQLKERGREGHTDGDLPNKAPWYNSGGSGDPTWAVGFGLIAHTLLEEYNDTRALNEQWEPLSKYATLVRTTLLDADGILPGTVGNFGDWHV